MAYYCPHCSQVYETSRKEAGSHVQCVTCSGQFIVPQHSLRGGEAVWGDLILPENSTLTTPQPAPFVVVASKPQPRLEATGWFARSFGSALGVLTAIVVVPVVLLFLACGGLAVLGTITAQPPTPSPAASDSITADAKRFAAPHLLKYGIVELSNDSLAWTNPAGHVQLTGKGRDADGGMHRVYVRFDTGEFGKVKQWSLDSIMIDGEIVE